MIGIYKITNQLNGKCYIGQSIDILQRWQQHICAAKYEKDNNKFYNALRKYGYENFNFEVIEECSNNQTILDERERYWINYYNSYEDGYNSTRGGQNKAWIYDPEIIKQMWDDGFTTGEIANILGCCKTTVNNRLHGYKNFNTFSSHQRSCGAMAKWRKTFQMNENQLKFFKNNNTIVHQYSLQGEYIASYPTLEAAAKAVNGKYPDNIGQCFRGNLHRTAYGYQWSKEKVDKLSPVSTPRGKLVHCLETDEYFPNTKEAAKWCGLKSSSAIKDYCRGYNNYKSAGKHPVTGEKLHWEYVE